MGNNISESAKHPSQQNLNGNPGELERQPSALPCSTEYMGKRLLEQHLVLQSLVKTSQQQDSELALCQETLKELTSLYPDTLITLWRRTEVELTPLFSMQTVELDVNLISFVLPVILKHQVWGMLGLTGITQIPAFDLLEVPFLQTIGSLLASGLQLHEQTHKEERQRHRLLKRNELLKALLEDSKNQFEQFANAAPLCMSMMDAEGKSIFYNRASLSLIQESESEALTKGWYRFIHPDDYQRVEEAYRAHLALHEGFTVEFRAVLHSGETRYFRQSAIPRFKLNGAFDGFTLIALDLTQERQLSDKFRRVVDSNMIGIMFWHQDGLITDANDAFLSIMCYSRNELEAGVLNWQAAQTSTPENKLIDALIWRELQETGVTHTYQKQLRRGDGSTAEILIGMAALRPGHIEEGVGFYLDISAGESIKADLEETLERERLTREILEATMQPKPWQPILQDIARVLGQQFNTDRCLVLYYPPLESMQANASNRTVLSGEYCASEEIQPLAVTLEAPQHYYLELLQLVSRQNLSPIGDIDALKEVISIHHLNSETYLPGLCSYLQMAIIFRGKTYGTIVFQHYHKENAWQQAACERLRTIVGYLGVAFYQAELYQQEKVILQALERSYQLINIVNHAQTHFIASEDSYSIFKDLLNQLLTFTNSQYGFIGEIFHDGESNPYLKTRFLTDISWNEDSHKLYLQSEKNGMEFHGLKTLFGFVMTTGQVVISNQPETDPRRGGLPEGHPPLRSFLGLPLYKGQELVGMIGIANRPEGYTLELADELQPYLAACANIITGFRNEQVREALTQELIEREKTLKDYAVRLESSNYELEQFASVASHDLQAPLRKVMLFSDYLQSSLGSNINEESQDYLRRIHKAVEKMQALISALLALSRVNRQGQPFSPVNLHDVLAEVTSDLEETILAKGAVVQFDSLLTIEADRVQMEQVFQNLVLNALKFQLQESKPFIQISAEMMDENHCKISVKDNGIGFDEKYLDRIFTIFERLHPDQAYEGTGMGLAIVKKIIDRHGGSITAHSQPGQGAVFVMVLPIHQTQKTKL